MTYTIRLFLPGSETPVAVYMGCTGYRTKPEHGTIVITRASGQETETDLYFEATSN